MLDSIAAKDVETAAVLLNKYHFKPGGIVEKVVARSMGYPGIWGIFDEIEDEPVAHMGDE